MPSAFIYDRIDVKYRPVMVLSLSWKDQCSRRHDGGLKAEPALIWTWGNKRVRWYVSNQTECLTNIQGNCRSCGRHPLHSDVGVSECIHQETVRPQAFATSSLQPHIHWLTVQVEGSGISIALCWCIRVHFAIAATKRLLNLRLLQWAACNLTYADWRYGTWRAHSLSAHNELNAIDNSVLTLVLIWTATASQVSAYSGWRRLRNSELQGQMSYPWRNSALLP